MATIITKNSQTASAVPSAASLSVGELAVNTADGKLYTEHTGGVVKEIIPSTVSDGGITEAKIATSAVTTTKIADANVTIAKLSATGTPSSSTFLRGDGSWQSAGGDFTVLDTQIFTASGTWTKPAGLSATDTVIAVVIGGGGGGDCIRDTDGYSLGGGGGGGVGVWAFPYSSTSNTAVTVGAGGAGKTDSGGGNFQAGGTGGTSSFGSSYRASGGAGGSGGAAFTTTTTAGLTSNTAYRNGGYSIGNSFFDGLTAAGAGMFSSTGSVFSRTGMTGSIFGVGGNAGNRTASTAGTAPGGGGGAGFAWNAVANSSAGARGEVRVYVVKGKVPAAAILDLTTGITFNA